MTHVQFCDEIEEFVSQESMSDWWNCGVTEYSISTFNLLREWNIPKRMSKLKSIKWKESIHEMLKMIPSQSKENLKPYLASIREKVYLHEEFTRADLPQILELAINGNHNTSIDAILEDQVVVPCVLSYLNASHILYS